MDDTRERADCRAWLYQQFHAGRDADGLLAELIGLGWPVEEAEALVEEGRRATRHLRGAITREEVARVAEVRYRNAIGIASKYAMGGLVWVIIHFLMSLLSFNRVPWPQSGRKPPKEAEDPQ